MAFSTMNEVECSSSSASASIAAISDGSTRAVSGSFFAESDFFRGIVGRVANVANIRHCILCTLALTAYTFLGRLSIIPFVGS